MSTILKLQRALAPNVTTNPADVLAAKTFLQAQGFYEAPEWGVTEYPDRGLFSAIEAFQKSKGLRVDGVMKPEGETETASQLIQAQALDLQSMGRNGDTVLAHITPAEAALLHDVTDGGSINPKTGLMEFWDGDNDSQFGDASAAAQSNDQASENDAQSGADFSGRESSDNMRTVDYVNARRDEDNARSIERAEARQAQAREIARQKQVEEDKRQKEKEIKAEEDRQRRVAELQKREEEEEEQNLLSKSKKTKDLNYADLDTENAHEFADQNAGVASDEQAKENERVSKRSYEDGRVKVRPLNQYWTPNRPPTPPSKNIPQVNPEDDPEQEYELSKREERRVNRALISLFRALIRRGMPPMLMMKDQIPSLTPSDDPA